MDTIQVIPGYPYLEKISPDSCNWICIFVIIAMFMLLILPRLKQYFQSESFNNVIQSEPAPLDGGDSGILPDPMRNAVCHPKCCLQTQWPVEHMKEDKSLDTTGLIQTEYSCKSCKNGVGCLCMTQQDYDNLRK